MCDIVSDLHIDQWDKEIGVKYPCGLVKQFPYTPDKPQNKILIVAGDVSDSLTNTLKYLDTISVYYEKILFVDGNHEHVNAFPNLYTHQEINEEIKNPESEAQVEESQEDIKEELSSEELIQQEKDKFLRLFAEFENYKKRTTKERIELFKTAGQELMASLLPIMDDFDRGLAEIKKVKDKELLKGIVLISDKLKKTLEQKGLKLMKVKAGDVFDADIHEAITQIPAPSKSMKGKIIEVIESGYLLGDKIIRFPKVVIGQ